MVTNDITLAKVFKGWSQSCHQQPRERCHNDFLLLQIGAGAGGEVKRERGGPLPEGPRVTPEAPSPSPLHKATPNATAARGTLLPQEGGSHVQALKGEKEPGAAKPSGFPGPPWPLQAAHERTEAVRASDGGCTEGGCRSKGPLGSRQGKRAFSPSHKCENLLSKGPNWGRAVAPW